MTPDKPRWIAWLGYIIAFFGLLALVEMVVGLFFGSFHLNFALLFLWLGPGIAQYHWRSACTFSVCFLLLAGGAGPLFLLVVLINADSLSTESAIWCAGIASVSIGLAILLFRQKKHFDCETIKISPRDIPRNLWPSVGVVSGLAVASSVVGWLRASEDERIRHAFSRVSSRDGSLADFVANSVVDFSLRGWVWAVAVAAWVGVGWYIARALRSGERVKAFHWPNLPHWKGPTVLVLLLLVGQLTFVAATWPDQRQIVSQVREFTLRVEAYDAVTQEPLPHAGYGFPRFDPTVYIGEARVQFAPPSALVANLYGTLPLSGTIQVKAEDYEGQAARFTFTGEEGEQTLKVYLQPLGQANERE
ncbi:MAG: hypothetical protein Q7P63_13385 [Verrucomicrobiota bacterium JB022]|nr:hypothetical protein [Verrucomicrobiota bacterium JB022]